MRLECPECGAQMELRPSQFKEGGVYYACTVEGCPGSHGAHRDGTPLGKPADQATKKMRISTHAVFDKLWQRGLMSRSEAYAWMQKTLGMAREDAHIANFDSETCSRLIRAVWKELSINEDSILPEEWR